MFLYLPVWLDEHLLLFSYPDDNKHDEIGQHCRLMTSSVIYKSGNIKDNKETSDVNIHDINESMLKKDMFVGAHTPRFMTFNPSLLDLHQDYFNMLTIYL